MAKGELTKRQLLLEDLAICEGCTAETEAWANEARFKRIVRDAEAVIEEKREIVRNATRMHYGAPRRLKALKQTKQKCERALLEHDHRHHIDRLTKLKKQEQELIKQLG